MNAAIAQKLNILESAILEIQEWAHVLLVRFVGGCRFVSKKVVKMPEIDKSKSLIHPASKLPQAQYDHKKIQKGIIKEISEITTDLHGWKELAEIICTQVVREDFAAIRAAYDKKGSLPLVYTENTSRLVAEAMYLIDRLDKDDTLENMMKKVRLDIDTRENPEAYC